MPASWRVLVKKGDAWEPVTGASEYGTKPDQFNKVTFEPVEAKEIRVEVRLQEKFSGGVLEWRVGG